MRMQFRSTFHNPHAKPWSRCDEARQRVGNCRRLLRFAWTALWTDSTLFAMVLVNSVRDVGDVMITKIVTEDGREIDHPET